MRARTPDDTSPTPVGSHVAADELARLLGLGPPPQVSRMATASSWLLSGIPVATLGLAIVLVVVLVRSLVPTG